MNLVRISDLSPADVRTIWRLAAAVMQLLLPVQMAILRYAAGG